MKHPSFARRYRLLATSVPLALVAACSALRQTAAPPPNFYSLDEARLEAPAATPSPSRPAIGSPTLIVSPPSAASGFDSQRIIYVREPHKLEYFANNEWIDTPARMLTPLIVAAAEASGAFGAVVATPSGATADLRLDTTITRLQHEFAGQPSRVRFTLRAELIDNRTRRILASREFDDSVAAESDTPVGGVAAASRAVHAVLGQLARFGADAAALWQPSDSGKTAVRAPPVR